MLSQHTFLAQSLDAIIPGTTKTEPSDCVVCWVGYPAVPHQTRLLTSGVCTTQMWFTFYPMVLIISDTFKYPKLKFSAVLKTHTTLSKKHTTWPKCHPPVHCYGYCDIINLYNTWLEMSSVFVLLPFNWPIRLQYIFSNASTKCKQVLWIAQIINNDQEDWIKLQWQI